MNTKSLLASFSLVAATLTASAQLSPPVPDNLGLGLRQLVETSQANQAQAPAVLAPSVPADSSGRVLVNVQLNGQIPLPELEGKLVELGLEITATDVHWRNGVLSAWLPISQAVAAANLSGIRSITLARKPVRRVGAVTAESSVVEKAAEVNKPGVLSAQGFLGRNISVGLVSDSFDTATAAPRASVGIASGDLPGPGNPDGYTQSVVVLKDDSTAGVADEGRGMAEIVHDIAPAAKICFSAAGNSQVAMANSIRNLRTSPQTLCDIIVDDIGFADEPFFSDGVISQAVDDVATSNSLPGKKVAYFSAAGNSNNRGYAGDANIISSGASAPYRGNLKFTSVPSSLYAGGFQNLNATGTPGIIMRVTTETGPAELVFQWDDPFNTGGVTTDYNLLVFSETGTYLGTLSGTDNNFSTSQPIEIVDLSPNTTYQLVISLASGGSPTARHLRMIGFGDSSITGDHLTEVISIFGHPAATNANAVAAYVYSTTPSTTTNFNPGQTNPPPGPYEPALEGFSSLGGDLPFYFNAQGLRLASPQFRRKPEFAAADGVDTSFFPQDAGADYDNNGFPNFFGTSAAAPNAGAIAALLLEATGGPGSFAPDQVRSVLSRATYPHDLDLHYSRANTVFASGGQTGEVLLEAAGDDSNESATSPAFFKLSFSSQVATEVQQVVIDVSRTSIVFDPRADVGFPFTVGQNTGNVSVTATLSPDLRILTLDFGNTFTSGKAISFGIDRDLAGINAGGNSADLLAGASVTVRTSSSAPLFDAFVNVLGHQFVPADGEGLLNARAAVEEMLGGHKVSSTGVSANLSTRARVGAGQDVLIGGLITSGTTSKKIVIRAIGPSLPLSGKLSDPFLELHNAVGTIIATNDNWQDDLVQAAEIQAAGLAPSDVHESAVLQTLTPNQYTAIVRGVNSTTGVGLVEVYDLDSQSAGSFVGNIATRADVLNGDDVMIAGFILQNGTSDITIRAIGPSMALSGTLADPMLELRDSQGNLLMANDNWQENPFQAVQLAATLAPSKGVESALITTLPANNYTAIVRGAHGTTGLAVVEVYNLR